ncbi:MAG: hypothetical protein GY860_26755 [Desulfobacteraceae bacterium]|nr:hypothetical protein [Desulfobacteraceae bacterium]
MRNILAVILISISLVVLALPGFAQDKEKKEWDVKFVHDLEKIRSQQKTGGLGYTMDEEEALKKAIKKAMDQKAPPCEVMKLAVDKNFNPYDVISGIFNSGADIDVNQLCMCATEAGISKSLTARAADAAAEANMLTRDEIAEAQCLREGLGFTEDEVAAAPPEDNSVKKDAYSKSVAGTEG